MTTLPTKTWWVSPDYEVVEADQVEDGWRVVIEEVGTGRRFTGMGKWSLMGAIADAQGVWYDALQKEAGDRAGDVSA